MHTVFSHIIQKRFSRVNEDVATDALAYLLDSSGPAREGMNKLLHGIDPDLPTLRFRTQQSEGSIRPDMWGYADGDPYVFVENKFWAGLTDNQPVAYLEKLASYDPSTVLLVVAPADRENTLWRELNRRLKNADIQVAETPCTAGVARSAKTSLGPTIALTSWTKVLTTLEHESVDDPRARGDLNQLRALCDAADTEAFAPVSNEVLTDQRIPAFILQLNSIVQQAVDSAVASQAVSVDGLRASSSGERFGRYLSMPRTHGAGAMLGVHLDLWKAHGTTPLWLGFSQGEFGRADEVDRLIEPWATKNDILTVAHDQEFAIALDIPTGEEKEGVVRALVDRLEGIATVLEALPPKVVANTNGADQ